MVKHVANGVMLVFAFGYLAAVDGIVAIDTQALLQESREGKEILAANEKLRDELFNYEYQQNKKILEFKSKLEEKVRAGRSLAEGELQEEYDALNRMQRTARRSLEEKKEDMESSMQGRVLKFRNKLLTTANNVLQQRGWNVVVDRRMPGVLCIADAVDKTKDVLKVVDEDYKKETAKAFISNKRSV